MAAGEGKVMVGKDLDRCHRSQGNDTELFSNW